MWFYSNSSGLKAILKSLMCILILCLILVRLYQSLLTRGWPDSEYFDYPSATDLRQFLSFA